MLPHDSGKFEAHSGWEGREGWEGVDGLEQTANASAAEQTKAKTSEQPIGFGSGSDLTCESD